MRPVAFDVSIPSRRERKTIPSTVKQTLAWAHDTGADLAKTNVKGGAIAIGHPLGASGARIMTTLVNALEQRGGRYGLQTMCEGGGMANATIIEQFIQAASQAKPKINPPAWPDPFGLQGSGWSKLEPAGAGSSNRLGGGRGQFAVAHAIEHPFHCGDNLRGCRGESGLIGCGDLVRVDARPGQHDGRVGQLIGQPGQRVS
jgi:hypothetical protein